MMKPKRERGANRCDGCAAPFEQGLAACPYCQIAYPGHEGGVPCPECRQVNLDDNTECVSCHASLVRVCVFCGAAGRWRDRSCGRCHEAYVGAGERKRAREEAAAKKQKEARREQLLRKAGRGARAAGAAAVTGLEAVGAAAAGGLALAGTAAVAVGAARAVDEAAPRGGLTGLLDMLFGNDEGDGDEGAQGDDTGESWGAEGEDEDEDEDERTSGDEAEGEEGEDEEE